MAHRNMMMATSRSLAYILLLSLPGNIAAAQEDGDLPKIAVVGGGLGGTATAYFLRQLFGDQLQVDVFEGEQVGGRLALINIEGQEYEAGGSVIHPRNEYMIKLTKLFGLKRLDLKDDEGIMGLYGKDGLFFKTSIWKAVTIAKQFWRYGWDVRRISEWLAGMMSSFNRIYEYQEKGMAFTAVEDMLKAMDERFINYTRISAQTMFKDAGFSEIFINELVMAAMRLNYGQTTDTHGFLAAVSMAWAESGLWAVKGGNKKVAESLLKASGASLIQGKVTHIHLMETAAGMPSYKIQYVQAEQRADERPSGEYDLVIIATPLDGNAKMKVKFEGFPSTFNIPNMPFHSLETVFVCGHVNLSTFGVDQQDDLPRNIMTTNAEVFFNSISLLTPVDEISNKAGKPEKSEEYQIWKVFLNEVPSEAQVQALFDTRKSLHLVNWLAYPKYWPIKELPSFVLHDRLYFINAIEAAASAMEMSVIGAKNVALLAHNQWYSHLDKIDEILVPSSQDSAQGKQVQDSVKSEEL